MINILILCENETQDLFIYNFSITLIMELNKQNWRLSAKQHISVGFHFVLFIFFSSFNNSVRYEQHGYLGPVHTVRFATAICFC